MSGSKLVCCLPALSLLNLLLCPLLVAEDDLEDVVGRAIAATHAAQEAIPSAKGEGRFVHKNTRSVNGEDVVKLHERGRFTLVYSGSLDFIKFIYEESDPQPEYDAKVYVNDGKRLWSSLFSPRVRPHGAEGEINELIDDSGGRFLFCVLPHAFPQAWAAIDRWRANSPDATIELTSEDGLHVVVLTGTEGFKEKFFVDPSRDYHVVELQMVMPDGKLLMSAKKYWEQTDDQLWYVQKFVHEDFPRNESSSHNTWSMEFTSFTPNVDLPAALFTPTALGLPPGARIIDRRTLPEDILKAEPLKVDRVFLESVVGPFPKPRPDDLRRRAPD